jgi:lysophospholipase L1-like esterase
MNNMIAKRLGCFALAIAAALLIAEVAIRSMGLTDLVLYQADDGAGYIPQPNQATRIRGVDIVINSWGLRDGRTIESEFTDGTRILVLGDSVTWGGVAMSQDNLFTTKLEGLLPKSEVLNAGVNGYSIAQMCARYQAHLHELTPDIVLLYTIPRDFTRAPRLELTGWHLAFPTHRPALALPVAFTAARLQLHKQTGWEWLAGPPATHPMDSGLTDDQFIAANIQAILDLRAVLPKTTRLLVAVSPTLPHPNNHPLPESVAPALEAADVSLHDLSATVQADASLFYDQVHLNAQGHARIAEALAKIVKESM